MGARHQHAVDMDDLRQAALDVVGGLGFEPVDLQVDLQVGMGRAAGDAVAAAGHHAALHEQLQHAGQHRDLGAGEDRIAMRQGDVVGRLDAKIDGMGHGTRS
jgi:hypothetical protein